MDMIVSVLTLIISFVLPIAILLYLILVKRNYLISFLLGTICFAFFQLFTRIPLIEMYLPTIDWYFTMMYTQPLLYALFLGLSAALFEELGRYVVMRYILRKKTLDNAIFFGLGHGGIEAILFVGINALMILISYKGISGNPQMMLLAGVERLSAMILHVCWSVLVMNSIIKAKPSFLIIAIISHFLLDSGVVLAQMAGISFVILEVILFLVAVASAYYVYNLFKNKEA